MRCLNGSQLPRVGEQIRDQASEIQRRGAAFVYSRAWAEWLIITRDVFAKRRLIDRYGRGVRVLTVDEVRELARLEPEDAAWVGGMVEMFGAEVKECRSGTRS